MATLYPNNKSNYSNKHTKIYITWVLQKTLLAIEWVAMHKNGVKTARSARVSPLTLLHSESKYNRVKPVDSAGFSPDSMNMQAGQRLELTFPAHSFCLVQFASLSTINPSGMLEFLPQDSGCRMNSLKPIITFWQLHKHVHYSTMTYSQSIPTIFYFFQYKIFCLYLQRYVSQWNKKYNIWQNNNRNNEIIELMSGLIKVYGYTLTGTNSAV